jgi:hypothetical protein
MMDIKITDVRCQKGDAGEYAARLNTSIMVKRIRKELLN